MNMNTYEALARMYDGLKAVNKNSAKLPMVTRSAIDLACLLATRDAITTWDETINSNNPHENFLELLTAELAEAQYNMAQIIARREGIEE